MRICTSLLLLAVLSGCTTDLTRLRELNPPAEGFAGSLASEYRSLAEAEAEEAHWSAAEHFASKGLIALKNGEVAPDEIGPDFDAPQAHELAEARAQLTRLLTDEGRKAAPQELARAQMLFDCWLHQAQLSLAVEKALCAPEFESALDKALEQAGPEIYGQAFRRSIAFAPYAAQLTPDHQEDIRYVVEKLSSLGRDYWVELRAYVGRKSSQQRLTESRIQAVKKALVKEGVPSRQIRVRREGASSVLFSRDNIPVNTKLVTITITAEPLGNAKGSK